VALKGLVSGQYFDVMGGIMFPVETDSIVGKDGNYLAGQVKAYGQLKCVPRFLKWQPSY
jgi:hypothetical protein